VGIVNASLRALVQSTRYVDRDGRERSLEPPDFGQIMKNCGNLATVNTVRTSGAIDSWNDDVVSGYT
jgi:hypothetical protein